MNPFQNLSDNFNEFIQLYEKIYMNGFEYGYEIGYKEKQLKDNEYFKRIDKYIMQIKKSLENIGQNVN